MGNLAGETAKMVKSMAQFGSYEKPQLIQSKKLEGKLLGEAWSDELVRIEPPRKLWRIGGQRKGGSKELCPG